MCQIFKCLFENCFENHTIISYVNYIMNTTIDKKSARATDLTTGEVTYFNSMSDVKRQLGIPTIVKKSIMVE